MSYRRQAALQAAAWPLDERIYAEDPDAFVGRMEKHWSIRCSGE